MNLHYGNFHALKGINMEIPEKEITSILIAFEMFGFKGVSFYLIAVSISYAASGYYGLYKDQTIVYSKYKAKYVNRHTRF